MLVLGTAAAAAAQFQRGVPFGTRIAAPADFDGRFNFCRLVYQGNRRGGSWTTDYPNADINMSIRFSELTKARVSFTPSGQPKHLLVRATDETLFQCPLVIMTAPGSAVFDDEEAAGLRTFLDKGGFLWADDFWGERAWAQFAGQIQRIVPEYRIVDVAPDHPLFAAYYTVKRVPQVPSIQHWRRSGGQTSERGSESAQTHMRGIFDDQGRLLVLMTHNTDISDGWEREGEDDEFFYLFSPEAYAVGLNVAIWTMTH